MKIRIEAGQPYLVFQEERISLDPRDLRMLKAMTPLGRKVYLRQKAKDAIRENPADSQAAVILKLSSLPAKNWAFTVPD